MKSKKLLGITVQKKYELKLWTSFVKWYQEHRLVENIVYQTVKNISVDFLNGLWRMQDEKEIEITRRNY